MGCVVLVLRSLPSCWSYSVAGIFRLAECEAGSVVGSPRGWFCVGTLHVCPVAVARGELLFEVWFHLLRNISDWEGVCERGVVVARVYSWADR